MIQHPNLIWTHLYQKRRTPTQRMDTAARSSVEGPNYMVLDLTAMMLNAAEEVERNLMRHQI